MSAKPSATRVDRTASALADLSLAGESGRFLGSEDELLLRFGVSRPTLRQAAKMVANDRLITVRRGTGGGVYSDRPDAGEAVRGAARYLRMNGATLHDVFAVNSMIAEHTAASAAACPDPALRAELESFSSRIDRNQSAGEIVRAENELAGLLARMSGNPAIELVMAIFFRFGMEEHRVRFYGSPGDRDKARELQHGLCRAVLSGDPDIARLMMRRRSTMLDEWFAQAEEGGQ